MVILISEDDQRYLQWLRDNVSGFVVNIRKEFDPDYVVLHRANCKTINSYPNMDKDPGGFTERLYRKVCGDSVSDLADYLKEYTDRSPPFSKACSVCDAGE